MVQRGWEVDSRRTWCAYASAIRSSRAEGARVRQPAVTVVIPCFNQGRFLRDALLSVQSQTFADWEAIVVDDGSTDGTREVASSVLDSRIRYCYQENRGLASARNVGIRAARGGVIALLDSDDTWEPLFLERMCRCLARHPGAAAAYCGFKYVDPEGREIGMPSLKVVPPECFHQTLMEDGNWLIPSAVIFTPAPAGEPGFFDEALGGVADTDLWIRLSARHPFIGLPEILARYRRHPAAMSRDPALMVADYRRMTEKLCGDPGGEHADREERKRSAHARLHRYGTLMYLEHSDVRRSAQHLRRLLILSPGVSGTMAFWRAAIRAHLPMEYGGGILTRSALSRSAQGLGALLDELAAGSEASPHPRLMPGLRSRAFLALADESVRSAVWSEAGAWLWRSAVASPAIVFSRPFWGTVARGMAKVARPGARLMLPR